MTDKLKLGSVEYEPSLDKSNYPHTQSRAFTIASHILEEWKEDMNGEWSDRDKHLIDACMRGMWLIMRHNSADLKELANQSYEINIEKKWNMLEPNDWDSDRGRDKIGSKIALIHSELSEALEWLRIAVTRDYLEKMFSFMSYDIIPGDDGIELSDEFLSELSYYKDKDIKHELCEMFTKVAMEPCHK